MSKNMSVALPIEASDMSRSAKLCAAIPRTYTFRTSVNVKPDTSPSNIIAVPSCNTYSLNNKSLRRSRTPEPSGNSKPALTVLSFVSNVAMHSTISDGADTLNCNMSNCPSLAK